MAKAGRAGLGLWDRVVLLLAWGVTCGLVYLLGFYVGKGMQERPLGPEDRLVRLPVVSTPPPAGQRPKAESDLTFYDTLAGSEPAVPHPPPEAPPPPTPTPAPPGPRPGTRRPGAGSGCPVGAARSRRGAGTPPPAPEGSRPHFRADATCPARGARSPCCPRSARSIGTPRDPSGGWQLDRPRESH